MSSNIFIIWSNAKQIQSTKYLELEHRHMMSPGLFENIIAALPQHLFKTCCTNASRYYKWDAAELNCVCQAKLSDSKFSSSVK